VFPVPTHRPVPGHCTRLQYNRTIDYIRIRRRYITVTLPDNIQALRACELRIAEQLHRFTLQVGMPAITDVLAEHPHAHG